MSVRLDHAARLQRAAAELNEAAAAAHRAGYTPWMTVMVGDGHPRPYTYIGAVAARRVSAATSGKGVRDVWPKEVRHELARLDGALARLKAEGVTE